MEFESEHPEEDLFSATPPCAVRDPEQQERLLEYLDGRLSVPERRAMLEHLAVCPECAALARQWTDLDLQLTVEFKACPVSPGFTARVWRAIESLPQEQTAGGVPAFDSEWAAAWAEHRRRFFWAQLPAALDQVGYASALALGVFFACRMIDRFLSSWPSTLQASPSHVPMAFGLGLSALVLLVTLGFTAKRPLARLLASL